MDTCKTCSTPCSDVYSPSIGPAPETAPAGTGYHSRSGGVLCPACLLAARAARAAEQPEREAAQARHREHQAAQRARSQPARAARAPKRRRVRPAVEVDRSGPWDGSSHPWAHDED